jgi:hypothetical protein
MLRGPGLAPRAGALHVAICPSQASASATGCCSASVSLPTAQTCMNGALMRIIRSCLSASAVALVTALVLAACDSSGLPHSAGPTAGKEFSAMRSAVGSATSVHVSESGSGPSVDVNVARSGSFGSFAMGRISFTQLLAGGTSYTKVTRSFLKFAKAPAGACAKYCGKWVVVPGPPLFAGAASLTMKHLIDQVLAHVLTRRLEAHLTALKAVTYRGQPAWSTRAGGFIYYFSRTGKPYLLGITGNGGVLDFSEWNTAKVPGPPSPSQIVQYAQLLHP